MREAAIAAAGSQCSLCTEAKGKGKGCSFGRACSQVACRLGFLCRQGSLAYHTKLPTRGVGKDGSSMYSFQTHLHFGLWRV